MKAPAVPSVDLVFRAFSDRTRLRILHLLRDRRELCVCDLVAVLGIPQAKASRHLAYLRRANLVLDRREGLWVHYRLAPASGPFHRKMLECLHCCLGEIPELARDLDRLQQRLDDADRDRVDRDRVAPAGCCERQPAGPARRSPEAVGRRRTASTQPPPTGRRVRKAGPLTSGRPGVVPNPRTGA